MVVAYYKVLQHIPGETSGNKEIPLKDSKISSQDSKPRPPDYETEGLSPTATVDQGQFCRKMGYEWAYAFGVCNELLSL